MCVDLRIPGSEIGKKSFLNFTVILQGGEIGEELHQIGNG